MLQLRGASRASNPSTELLGTVLEHCPGWMEPNSVQSMSVLFNQLMLIILVLFIIQVIQVCLFHKLNQLISKIACFKLKMLLFSSPNLSAEGGEPVLRADVHGGCRGETKDCIDTVLLQALQRPGPLCPCSQHHLWVQGQRSHLFTGEIKLPIPCPSQPESLGAV